MPARANHMFHPPKRRALSVLVRLGVSLALALMTMPVATTAAAPPKAHPAINSHHGQSDVDVRANLQANIKQTAAQRNEIKALKASARWNERTGTVGSLTRFGGYLTPKSTLGAVAIARAFLAAHTGIFGLSRADVAAMNVTTNYVTKHNGVTQLTLQQTSAGLAVYGAYVTFAIDRSGRILTVGNRAAPSHGAQAAPKINAADAVAASAAAVGADRAALTEVSRDAGPAQKTVFKNSVAKGLKNPSDISAELVVFPMVGGRAARLGWRTVVEATDVGWYESIVDSATSAVLYRVNYSHDAGPEGQVWTGENPNIGTQHIVSFAGDPAFDNNGWLGASTTTSGNNVNAYQDLNNSNAVGFQPTEATQHFNYNFTNAYGTAPNTDVTTDRQAVVTQLFYYTNFMHDYLYRLGFDEPSRNFQIDNFGRGGAGNDAVLAEADDGFNFGCTTGSPPVAVRCLNNANFNTPPDGNAPRMQMYLWTSPFVDGDMDGGIIAHEYGHGLSNRLIAGGVMGSGTQTGAIGEGNSDFWANTIYNTPVIGAYVTGNAATGLRRVAYNNSNWTYASLCNAGCEVHNDGEIWASALWDLRQSLINHSTFAAGKATAEQLVIDGLKATVTSPTFLDTRDGILAADVANNAGANQCLIWSVFSLRGMGVSASSSSDQNTVTNGFDLPPECYPDVRITKSASPNPVVAGNELIYSLNVTNDGPVTATNVSVVDTIPAGTSYVTSTIPCVEAPTRTLTCAIGTMQDGTSKGFQIKVLVSSTIDLGGGPTSITNTATVSQTQPDGQPLNNTATAATIVNESSDLQVAKTCDATVLAGQSGSCTIYVDNNGPSAARNVTLTDVASSDGTFTMSSAVPSQGSCVISPTTPSTSATATCSLGNLGATTISGPGRATIVVTYTADEGQKITDQATATSPTPDPASGNNTASASLPITAVADLEITADTAAPPTPSAGEGLTFSVTVRNNGPSTAKTVVLKDALPAGITINNVTAPGATSCNVGVPGDPLQPVTCGFDVLAKGASRTMTINTTIKPQTQGSLHSDAAASAATFDPNNSNNFAHTDTTVAVVANLALAMSASPTSVIAGRPLTWTAVVSNGGPSTARGVTLDETLPAGVTFNSANISNGAIGTCAQVVGQPNHIACQLNDLDPGASATVLTQVTVDAATAKNTVLTASGIAATSSSDPALANNSTSASSTVDTLADLAVSLTAPSHVYSPSTTVTYTAGVVNGGPSDAQTVVLRVNLPGTKVGHYVSNNAPAGVCSVTTSTPASIVVTCNLNTLAAAASRSIQVVYFIQGNQKIQTSTDSVNSSTADPVAANNTASWTVGPK